QSVWAVRVGPQRRPWSDRLTGHAGRPNRSETSIHGEPVARRRNPEGRTPQEDTYGILRGSIPIFFIRVIRVVRFRPKRAAAPEGPPTRPLVSLRTRIILFCSSMLPALAGAGVTPRFPNS